MAEPINFGQVEKHIHNGVDSPKIEASNVRSLETFVDDLIPTDKNTKDLTVGEDVDVSSNPVPVFISNDVVLKDSIEQIIDNSSRAIWGSNQVAQTFTTPASATERNTIVVKKIILNLRRFNSPGGTFNVDIFATSSGEPTGASLANANIAANSIDTSAILITFAFNLSLLSGTKYAIVASNASGSGTDNIIWFRQTTSVYAGGNGLTSPDGGSAWSAQTDDQYFVFEYDYFFGTTGQIYKSDANDNDRTRFNGFATTTATSGNTSTIQLSAIVPGFSGLEEGEDYFIQDTIGTIGVSIGTTEILTGIAISPTEIIIRKGSFELIATDTYASTVTSTTVEMPAIARFAIFNIQATGTESSIKAYVMIARKGITSVTVRDHGETSTPDRFVQVITSLSSNTITLTVSAQSSPSLANGTVNFYK